MWVHDDERLWPWLPDLNDGWWWWWRVIFAGGRWRGGWDATLLENLRFGTELETWRNLRGGEGIYFKVGERRFLKYVLFLVGC